MKEWYLITPNTRPNMISGYENEAFTDYKQDAFIESLQTDLASTAILYNSDLSIGQEIKCIIQGNAADTQLKSLERIGLFIIGSVKAGMYIFHENRYWLITGYPGNNGIYEKATMILCQYKLRWQNSLGNIIERWCNGSSASKYDVGEGGNNIITLSSNTFMLLLPDDSDVVELDGKRVFIDKDKIKPTKVYKITRSDDILYDYGDEHGGILSFIADKKELNINTDNQELRICDYFSPTAPFTPSVECTILSAISGSKNLRVGYPKTYSVTFTDKDGNELSDVDYEWRIASDFDDKISRVINGDTIKLQVDDENYDNSSFILQIIIDDEISDEMVINIISTFN